MFYGLKIIEKNPKYSLKRERAFNILREDTAPGSCPNRWTVRETLLQSILDNWAVFQDMWDGTLDGKVDSKIWGQVVRIQTQKQSFNFFFWIQLGVFMYIDNLSFTLQCTHVMLERSVNCKSFSTCFSTLQGMREEVSFNIFLEKMTPNCLGKEKFRFIMTKKKLP